MASLDFDLKLNDREIVGALTEPFNQANELLGRQFTKEITSNKWSWPTEPSPRDIVDLNQLRDSYEGERIHEATGPAYLHTYNTRYAMPVHEGAHFRPDSKWGRIWTAIRGRPEMPARPWMYQGLKDFDIAKAFSALAQARLGRIQ